MAQVPTAYSLASASTAQLNGFDTCAVGGGGWKQSHNASIGDQWGQCPWDDMGTTREVDDRWKDRTNVDKFSLQSAMGFPEYGVPYFDSNGASPPWMTE